MSALESSAILARSSALMKVWTPTDIPLKKGRVSEDYVSLGESKATLTRSSGVEGGVDTN
jgi:hypothetical protein